MRQASWVHAAMTGNVARDRRAQNIATDSGSQNRRMKNHRKITMGSDMK